MKTLIDKKSMRNFTIAIPTYNRNEILTETIVKLIPQLKPWHHLLIIDNCSDIPVADGIQSKIRFSNEINVKIVRNNINIGGGANILRCVELCETEWLYCLGDDDLILENALNIISQTIDQNPDCLYINFSRNEYIRKTPKISKGVTEFIQTLDDWPTFLFMSSSVFNCRSLKNEIRIAYLNLYTWAPIQSALLLSLKTDGTVLFSEKIICDQTSLADTTWNPLTVAAGKMVLPDLIQTESNRNAFARKISARPGITFLAYFAAVTNEIDNENRHQFNIFVSRCRLYKIGFLRHTYGSLLSLLLKLPKSIRYSLFSTIPTLISLIGRAPILPIKVDSDRT